MDNAELDKVGPIQRYYYEDMMCRRDNEVEKWHSAWGGIIGFIYYERQFITEEQTVTQDIDTGDGDLVMTGIGDLYYGESPTNSQNTQANP